MDTLGPYVSNVTRVATACSQHGTTATGAVPRETQVAALDFGRPSAAPATRAGKTPPAGSIDLNLGLKTVQRQESSAVTLLSPLPFLIPGGFCPTLVFSLAVLPGTHPTFHGIPGEGKGPKEDIYTISKPEAL